MRLKRFRALSALLAATLVTTLITSLGVLTALPAQADGPPVTFSLAATDRGTGAPITEVEAGGQFHFTASSGCPDPAGCGPATLTVVFPAEVEFVAGEFNPPSGATVTVTPEGGPATGKTVTLTWAELEGVSVAHLPARVPADVGAELDGSEQTAEAIMVGGAGEHTTTIETAATVALRVYEKPGLANVGQSWSVPSVPEGTGTAARATVSGTATANTLSTLIFRAPSGAALPGGALPVAEAFDLTAISLAENTLGATVVFEVAGGPGVQHELPPGELTVAAPANAIGYRVEVSGLPGLVGSAAAERTVTVHADYVLRSTQRTSGERIIASSANTRQVRASALVTNEVTDPAPGVSPAVDGQAHSDIVVAALLPEIQSDLTWVTDSGDNTSVYGSKEGSSSTLRVANTGQSQLRELSVKVTNSGSGFFEYQRLETLPDLVFPAGATSATIQYHFIGSPASGAVQPFGPGDTVPGPDADGQQLGDVSGITIVFLAADGAAMSGGCALDDAACAGQVTLSGSLRDARLSNGAPIVPPANNPGTTTVSHLVDLTAVATTGATVNLTTARTLLLIVKPQLTVTLSKRYGDGSTNVVYPLTGIAQAGDLYDPEQGAAGFRDHAFRLVAGTAPAENATEMQGTRELTIVDPQTAPTLGNLKSGPFNAVRFTALPDGEAVCTTGGDEAAGEAPTTVRNTTDTQVWVVDRVDNPQQISKVPFDATIDLELVVGVEYRILPLDRSSSFPVDLRCATPAGATVMFREHRLSDGALVSPATIGSTDTPGLFAAGNTAEVRTGQHTATATGSDQLFLIELERAAVYKSVAAGARSYGIQDQSSPTGFLLSGVPAGQNSVESRIIDGGHTGRSLDVFALTGVRDARLGPDQVLTVRFRDQSGAEIGPVGRVDAGTTLNGASLTPEQIEDSQSAAYLEFQGTKRPIEWSEDWAEGARNAVFALEVSVSRADPEQALQRYGAFSVVADMTLRSHLLSDPSTAVDGTLNGKVYKNYADLASRALDESWSTDTYTSSAEFLVYAANELFGGSELRWGTSEDSDNFLVGLHQTRSRVTLDVWNKTALGVKDVDPGNQWEAPNSIAVGVDSLSASIGDAPTPETNPFLITDFQGIESMRWPERDGAPEGASAAEKFVAGEITYQLRDGSTKTVAAPVGASAAQLNPDPAIWPDITGITVTWQESGKYVGTKRPSDNVHGRLVFLTSLRDNVRAGSTSYTFLEGTPNVLAPNAPITGPLPGSPAQVAGQVAVTTIAFDTLPGTVTDTPGQIVIARPATDLGLELRPDGRELFRDPDRWSEQRWTVAVQNKSNISVAALQLATDKQLLAEGWPSNDPSGFQVVPGSVFDVFNVTGARVQYPSGAVSATLWARGEDGTWTAAIPARHNTALALPQTGPGPNSWAEVTGFRVRFDGDEDELKRIAKQGKGTLLIDTKMRHALRSDPNELAPGTALPAGSDSWESALTAAGSLHLTTAAEEPEPADLTSSVTIKAGTPLPSMRKFAGSHTNNSTSEVGNPGAWINFDLVLSNAANASSNLYGLSALDVFPEGLNYNAVNANTTWRVSAPEGISVEPEFSLEPGTPSTMRWTWPEDQSLKPGEKIVITVPLQVSDGSGAGTTATNTGRVVGSGIEGALNPSVCAEVASPNAACSAQAFVTSLRNDSVRGESYIDARHGSATVSGAECDASTVSDWADGTWVRNPCVAETTTGDTLRYRLKLINSGNIDLQQLRYVDELPETGDRGTVLTSPRGSEWNPALLPGSVRLLTGAAATDLGARGDGMILPPGTRYSATENACRLYPDAFSGPQTLVCDDGAWSGIASKTSKSFGGDIVFSEEDPLHGGEYVIVEFVLTVPSTGLEGTRSWNSAAVTGRTAPVAHWLPASETPLSGARAQDAEMTVSLSLAETPAAAWHLLATGYTVDYSCLAPGSSTPVTGSQALAGIADLTKPSEAVIGDLPRGAECRVTNLTYTPTEDTSASGQYGSAADGVTGFSFATDPEESIVLGEDPEANIIRITNTFAEATVTLGVTAEGTAVGMLPEDAEFTVQMQCVFGGITGETRTVALQRGETHEVTGLPVGADCAIAETDHRGAARVTATLDGEEAPLTEQRSLSAEALDPGPHEAVFRNTFDAGGALTVLKRLELPQAGLASGDVRFALSCQLGGYPLDLGEEASLGFAFSPGQTSASGSVAGLPVDAECTVHETEAGGADEPAPDRTATILPEDEVIVEMVNRFAPAALELSKELAGAGASESRVPGSFDLRASCTRDLVVAGNPVTVTDHDAVSAVSPGTPVMLDGLPKGSRCTVTEEDARGAERTEIEVLGTEARDEDPAEDAATVALPGPASGGDGAAVVTRVRVTNHFAATPGLSVTGSDHRPAAALAILLTLLGMGVALHAHRRRDLA